MAINYIGQLPKKDGIHSKDTWQGKKTQAARSASKWPGKTESWKFDGNTTALQRLEGDSLESESKHSRGRNNSHEIVSDSYKNSKETASRGWKNVEKMFIESWENGAPYYSVVK